MDSEGYGGEEGVVVGPENAFLERRFRGGIGGILVLLCGMHLCFRGLRR